MYLATWYHSSRGRLRLRSKLLPRTGPATTVTSRHSALVRVTHWITTLCFLRPARQRNRNRRSLTRASIGVRPATSDSRLFKMPIPASRRLVPTGYGYVLPDQNGWSRYLHFQAAWVVVLTGLLYVIFGLVTGHFRKNLLPRGADRSWRQFLGRIASHLRFRRPSAAEAWSYNLLQRLALLFVIFVLFPLVIWTGLAMSPGFRFRGSGDRHAARRPAIRAHAALLRLPGSGAFPCWSTS